MRDFGLRKLYYSISEVSKLTGLEQYILRYWENEFDQLKPAKNRAGNRIYTNKDIKLILEIKKLLRDKKYTIEGAKNILQEKLVNKAKTKSSKNEITVPSSVEPEPEENYTEEDKLKKDLVELREFLLDLKSKI
ncbi:MAG: MerR family transcriptional regulator [Ignavibacteria bacterium]|nr:MAG: MerR family transcriptional regulator [Ignavibacteria bacterium]